VKEILSWRCVAFSVTLALNANGLTMTFEIQIAPVTAAAGAQRSERSAVVDFAQP